MQYLSIVKNKIERLSNIQMIVLSYLSMAFLGGIILSLPISSRNFTYTNFFESCFEAMSFVSSTGINIYDTWSQWSIFGQLIILLLIQFGGIGIVYITSVKTTIFASNFKIKVNIKRQTKSQNIKEYTSSQFILIVTFFIELIGSILLSIKFIPKYGAYGIWVSIFTSISAFCNSGVIITGFMTPNSSVMEFRNEPFILFIVALLTIIGGIGYIVLLDICRSKYNFLCKTSSKTPLSLHSKIILRTNLILIILGTLIFLILENNNSYSDISNIFEKISLSFFQSVCTRTSGFYVISPFRLLDITKLFIIIFMSIGAAPLSTGGGITLTPILVIFNIVKSFFTTNNNRVHKNIIIHKHEIKLFNMFKSICIISLFFMATMLGGTTLYILQNNQKIKLIDILFETVSALSTTGIPIITTNSLSVLSLCIIMVLMFIGRLGIISIILSVKKFKPSNKNVHHPEAKIIID